MGHYYRWKAQRQIFVCYKCNIISAVDQAALWTWVGLSLYNTIACLQELAPFYDFENGPKFMQ